MPKTIKWYGTSLAALGFGIMFTGVGLLFSYPIGTFAGAILFCVGGCMIWRAYSLTRKVAEKMTLHNEFEQNVKTLAVILHKSIETIDKWLEDLKGVNERNWFYFLKRTSDDVISIAQSFYPFRDLFPEIQRFLIHHNPNFTGKVEKVYSNIRSKSEEIVGKCSFAPLGLQTRPAIPYGEMCDLKGSIEELAKDLHYCVRADKEEREEDL